jgi:hypothetical protein
MKGQPKLFTWGIGHVKFFYDKQLFLYERYKEIYIECKKRGFNVTDYSGEWKDIPIHLWNNYIPTDRDRQIVRERIAERLESKKK